MRESPTGDRRELCVGCHPAEAVVAGTRHDLAETRGTTCGPCHSVHDPLAVASWPAARGGGDRATADLGGYSALRHQAGEVASGAVVDGNFHPAGPMAGVQGVKGVGCVGCHDPHRWNPSDAADRGGAAAGDAGTTFLVRSAAGSAPTLSGLSPGTDRGRGDAARSRRGRGRRPASARRATASTGTSPL